MRILFLLTQDLESPLGVGRIGPLARELSRLGHSVRISALHPNLGSLARRSYQLDDVLVRYAGPMHVIKRGDLKTYYPTYRLLPILIQSTLGLTRDALRGTSDIIHVCKPHPMNSLAGLLSSKLQKSRLFLDCDDYEAASGRFANRLQRWGITFFEEWMPRMSDHITTNTHFMRNRFIQKGIAQDQIFYLSNGVDMKRFSNLDPEQIHKLRIDLELDDKKVIAFVGSLSKPSHPVDLLLEAFATISLRREDARLLIVGGGEEFPRIRRIAEALKLSDAIRLVGRVAPSEIPLYYQLADVSVDPVDDNDAARGRAPLKLFESWAAKTPFISADVGDRSLLLGSPPAGILVEPGNAIALAEAVLSILTDKDLAMTLQKRGWDRVQEFTWDKLALGLEQYYRQNI